MAGKKEEILKTAVSLFAPKGYDGTSVALLANPAEAAIADRGLLSKEELKAFHRRSDLRGLYELTFA